MTAAKIFAPESNCVLANVDADDKKNRPLADRYNIGSFPTILFYPKGNKGTNMSFIYDLW